MAVLITGGAGFIGKTLAREIAAAGRDVLAVDIGDSADFGTDDEGRLGIPESGRIEYRQCDITDRGYLFRLVAEAGAHGGIPGPSPTGDPVIHLAGILTAGCDRNPDAAMAVNVEGFRSVLEAVRQYRLGTAGADGPGAPRVVLAGTIGVYGRDLPQPIKEEMPAEPDGWYGVTKYISEQIGGLYARKHGIDFRAVRMAAVTGAGRSAGSGSASLFTSFIAEKAAKGEPYTIEASEDTAYPVVYIKDAVAAIRAVVDAQEAPSRIYNVASGRVVVSEMIERVKRRIPEAKYAFAPDPVVMEVVSGYKEWRIDCSRIEKELGWRPEFGPGQMIDDIIDTVRRS
jgi:nucleoside-diphosphate-sugar epimerase